MPKVTTLRLTISVSSETYFPSTFSNWRLKPSMSQLIGERDLGLPWSLRRIIAQSTGVSVSATTPEITIALAIVIANWR